MKGVAKVALVLLISLPWSERMELGASPQDPTAQHLHSCTVRAAAVFETGESSSNESHREILEWVNFLLLVAVLIYLLRKPLAGFFAERLDTIQEGLGEGRRAVAASEAKLAEVEKKLKDLEREIADFRARSELEMKAERERLQQAAEREGQRMMDFARTQIEAAARAARLEVKRYAAGQAVELAESVIRRRLDEPLRHQLVSQFVAHLKEPGLKN